MSGTQAAPPRLTLPPQGGGWRQTLWATLGVLMFAGMLIAAGIWTLPNLVTDWSIRNTAQPVERGTVTEGSCNSRIIFHICDATLAVPTKNGRVLHNVNYVFTDVHVGDYSVMVMADPDRPELATTDMALDKLWNRTITLFVGAAVMILLIVGPLIGFFRRRRAAS